MYFIQESLKYISITKKDLFHSIVSEIIWKNKKKNTNQHEKRNQKLIKKTIKSTEKIKTKE